jgi:hypothetical protein
MTELSVQQPVFQPSTPTTQANPIAHSRAGRSVMMRGAGLEVAYLPLLVLVLIPGAAELNLPFTAEAARS